jgi:SecD/SecF fusion protein
MSDRRRNSLVLLLVALLLAVSAIVIATKPTRLGLDLKGGVSFIYKGIPTAHAKVNQESLNRAIDIMRKRVDQLGVAQPEIQLYGGSEINVSLPDVTNVKRAEEQVGKTAQLLFYDWEPNVIGPSGNPEPANRAATCGPEPAAVRCGLPEYKAVLLAAKRKPILRSNATTLHPGCTPAQLHGCIYGAWYLLDTKHEKMLCVDGKPICGPADTQAELYADGYKPPAGAVAKAVRVNPGTVLVQAHPEEFKNKVVKAEPNSFYVLNDNPVLEGGDINNPQQGYQSEGGGSGLPDVTFGFDSHGKTVFERVTAEIAKRGENAQLPGVSKAEALQHFAIVLDEQVITAPSIDYTVYEHGIDASNGSEITGGFTLTSAQNLANELQSGALPIKLEQISHSQVSATLGKTALDQGLLAMAVGLLVVCLFLLTFYRVLGIIAIGGLAIYGVYYFALIKAIPIVLTLPGIAGLILTIGIAADANIVIFERIKEEIRAGRSIPAGIAAGYKRGFAAIVDANVVTFMTAFILFALATAEVQGFAFTLGIGTLLSLFTAVLATQAALGAMGRSRVIGHPALLGAARAKRALRFDFMGASKWFFSLSGTILLIGALAIGGKGINFGIDFTSGTRIQTGFVKPISQEQIRTVLREHNLSNAQIQKLTGDKSVGGSGYQISVKQLKPAKVAAVEEALGRISPLRDVSDSSIGPTFGSTVARAAIIAIIASLLVISVYIALRFEWKYAVPVLIALMHDLLITSGVYALTGREVSSATVAALLTILGYSLYDTIIVFDRVRENVPRMPRAAFSQIVNRSMSEVLTRSLATSFCTLLPVLSLLLFGGETLKNFAFALMVGIASGAYSSIFIASPVLTHWKEREGAYRNRRARLLRDLGEVPAYATALDGTPIDVEPARERRRRRAGGLLVAEEPGEQVTQEEFEEMVRDLDIEGDGDPTRPAAGRGRTRAGGGARGNGRGDRVGRGAGGGGSAVGAGTIASSPSPPRSGAPAKPAAKAPAEATPQEPAADLTPEDLVLEHQPKRAKRAGGRRNKRHGRSR